MSERDTATDVVNKLGARWSTNLEDYAAGKASAPECVLCRPHPCHCAPAKKRR